MRAASADRERAVDVLRAGFAEGRLTLEEYNDRMGRAYESRTYGELQALTGDLPAGAIPVPLAPAWQPAPPVSKNPVAVAALVFGLAEFVTFGLTAIPAIVCGHIARVQIRRNGQDGNGMATVGLALGYPALVLWAGMIMVALVMLGHMSGNGPYTGP